MVRDFKAVGFAKLEVIGTMAWGDMHEASARIHGHEITVQHWNIVVISQATQGMRCDGSKQFLARHLCQYCVRFDPHGFAGGFNQSLAK